jgi:hypothetical protein
MEDSPEGNTGVNGLLMAWSGRWGSDPDCLVWRNATDW